MAMLFDKGVPTINEHIKNIYKERELRQNSTIRKFRIVQKEGGRIVKRDIDFYNLDVIISVGYRVKSFHGTQFRIWATKTLKEHLVKGYSINEKRLLQSRNQLKELQGAINFLQEKAKYKLLSGQEQEILSLLASYSKTLSLLERYDKNKLTLIKKAKGKFILTYKDVKQVIQKIKTELINKKEASDLFGQETGENFKAILGNIYQTFDKKELYPSLVDVKKEKMGLLSWKNSPKGRILKSDTIIAKNYLEEVEIKKLRHYHDEIFLHCVPKFRRFNLCKRSS